MLTTLRYDKSPPILSQCLFATGRSCLVHLIEKFKPNAVFLPQMYPEGLIDPFKRKNVEVVFYPLDNELAPVLDQLIIATTMRPLIVVVHFFGYKMPTAHAAAIAHQHGGLLLEDCAHCVPKKTNPTCADLTLYSYNKFFPVVDGAALQSYTPEVLLDDNEIVGRDCLPENAINAYRRQMAEARIMANMPPPRTQLEMDLYTSTAKRIVDAYEEYYKAISTDMEPKKSTINLQSISPIVEADIRNSTASALLKMLPGKRLYRNDCPQFVFPIRCDDRNETQMKLLKAGIIARSLGDKWSSDETDFWKNHLLLPVRDMTEDKFQSIKRILT